jgi:transposase
VLSPGTAAPDGAKAFSGSIQTGYSANQKKCPDQSGASRACHKAWVGTFGMCAPERPCKVLKRTFNVVKHLSDALDDIRRSEYKRVTGDDRSFIKGQRYVLLSRRENLTGDKHENLERLLQANARLNVAYILREQFGQLWDYADAGDARAFFDARRGQLRDQDLKPYEKFARMAEKHWDRIAVHCQPTHTIPLGFVEGLNNKIRVIQRKAYGLRDEEYLALKIQPLGLPEL